ncbi:MAG TPA: hypothetical protein VGH23_00040 [Rhizomicrobium sp.]|jgi:hypothetical protein
MAKSVTSISRQELYDLVWERPTRTVASELGVSDVALAKACRRAEIPIPPRGYWARKAAGQKPTKIPLPLRFPGAADELWIGGHQYRHWHHYSEEELLNMPEPPLPVFEESMEAVASRVEKMVRPIAAARNFDKAFGDISRLLAHDEERRRRASSYDKPRYDSGVQRRRLLLLNSIFLAARSLGCSASMTTSKWQVDDPQHRGICITVGAQHVNFMLESPNFKNTRGRIDKEDNRLKLSLGSPSNPDACGKFWIDADKRKLESQIREFMIAVLIKAEQQHRDHAFHHREWLIKQKEDAIKELARHKAEQGRREKEQRVREEKAKVDSLLRQAEDMHKAMTIRVYVQEIRRRHSAASGGSEAFENWFEWALGVADQLDPAMHPELLLFPSAPGALAASKP